MDEPQPATPPPGDARKRPPPGGPFRLCCTCAAIAGGVALILAISVGVIWRRAYDPALAAAALPELLQATPPARYQASFQLRWFGVETVLMGPAGVDLRTPQGAGLRMMLGVLAIPPASDGPRVQRELVEWLGQNRGFQLRVDETRTVPVTVRGQTVTATEVLGTVQIGGERCRLLTVVVPRKADEPQGGKVLVGALGGRESFDQAAWDELLASIR